MIRWSHGENGSTAEVLDGFLEMTVTATYKNRESEPRYWLAEVRAKKLRKLGRFPSREEGIKACEAELGVIASQLRHSGDEPIQV